MKVIYPACFYKDVKGTYSVIFNDLDIATCGDSLDDAMEMAIDLLAGHLHTAKVEGELIPPPSKLNDIKLDIDDDIVEKFVNMVYVDVEEYAKKHFNKAVKKTLTVPAWLNDLAIKNNVNFSGVLQSALMEQLGVDN